MKIYNLLCMYAPCYLIKTFIQQEQQHQQFMKKGGNEPNE